MNTSKPARRNLLRSCRNTEQRQWLDSVISYFQVYCCRLPREDLATDIIPICQRNPPIFTNAAGGCGNSWLISQVVAVVTKCIARNTRPSLLQDGTDHCIPNGTSSTDELYFAQSDLRVGRLGRVAIFAPSWVAASITKGFTFHNGLRTAQITTAKLTGELSVAAISELTADFLAVLCLVVDEFSMTSLLLLAYLDKIIRLVRPTNSHVMFGGIPLILTRDAYQLPVVNGCSLMYDGKKFQTSSFLYTSSSRQPLLACICQRV